MALRGLMGGSVQEEDDGKDHDERRTKPGGKNKNNIAAQRWSGRINVVRKNVVRENVRRIVT